MLYIQTMLKKFGMTVPASMVREREIDKMYDDNSPQMNVPMADPSDDYSSVGARRHALMKELERSEVRSKRYLEEKHQLEYRRREVIFLLEAEDALSAGINQSLTRINQLDEDKCEDKPEAPERPRY